MICSGVNCSGWLRRLAYGLAAATTISTLPLLFSGGSVTSYGVGMAVPDWPTTFGENMVTYNFLDAPFGVQVEHSHRLIGMIVGLLGMSALIATLTSTAPASAKWTMAAGFSFICIQGLLGGLRVELNKAGWGPQLAIAHGAFGQLTFCGLFAATSSLATCADKRPIFQGDFGGLRLLSLTLPALWFVQLVSGAFLRHLGLGFVVHAVVAGGLLFAAVTFIFQAMLVAEAKTAIGRLAPILGLLLLAQVALGLGAALTTELIPPQWRTWSPSHGAALMRTLHQFNSALVGACMVAIAWRVQTQLQPLDNAVNADLPMEATA